MSEAIRRRSSSRQLLQNLIRVTVQRSQEDAEEVEREKRRRAREKQRGEASPSSAEPPQLNNVTQTTVQQPTYELDDELKPSCCLLVDEDEGFSDWSHRLENRSECEDRRAKEKRASTLEWKPDNEEERLQEAKEDARLPQSAGSQKNTMSFLVAGSLKQSGGVCQVDGAEAYEGEELQQIHWTYAERCQQPGNEESPEHHKTSFLQKPNDESTPVKKQKVSKERSVEDRDKRGEEMERSADSLCSSEGEMPLSCYGPMSPTFKKLLIQFYPEEVNSRIPSENKCTIIERTESLRKSTQGTKKMSPTVSVAKIDKRLQQYTHALEVSSKEDRSGTQVLADLMISPESINSKKSIFEAGEAWNQDSLPITPTKSQNADGFNIGVSDLINQWVTGREVGSGYNTISKPADIKPGGVLNKKNLWESFSDAIPTGREGKESPADKRCKFVVTGHGKYQKVFSDNSCSEDVDWTA